MGFEDEQIRLYCLHARNLYEMTAQFPELSEDTNFVFLFAPNDKTEIVHQQGDNITLYELAMGADAPEATKTWSMDAVPDLGGSLHSGIRFKDEKYMFLIDYDNFYQIDTSTNTSHTFWD